MAQFIPCMCCGTTYTDTWLWWVCDTCGYRICMSCYTKHSGPYARNGGGKCSQCMMGQLKGPKRLK